MSHICKFLNKNADQEARLLRASSHLQFVLQLLVLLGLGESLLLLTVVAQVLRLQLGAVGAVLLAVLVVALAV